MTAKFAWAIAAAFLTLINLATLAANLSIKAHAEVAGMDSTDLEQDDDFRTAVRHVARHLIEDCKVDDDEIRC